jgi:hypothetical protein
MPDNSYPRKPWVEDVPYRDSQRSFKALMIPMGKDKEGRERTPFRLSKWQAIAVVEFYDDIRDFIKAEGR